MLGLGPVDPELGTQIGGFNSGVQLGTALYTKPAMPKQQSNSQARPDRANPDEMTPFQQENITNGRL